MNEVCQASCHMCSDSHSTPPRNTVGNTVAPPTPTPPTPPPTPPPTFETCHYIECGRNNGCGSRRGECAVHSTLHEVRCCSDVNLNNGWRNNYCESVWGESDDPARGWECNHGATFDEAALICQEVGARLCTRQELRNDCTRGTGCGHDRDLIWTSDEDYLQVGPQLAAENSGSADGVQPPGTSTEEPATTEPTTNLSGASGGSSNDDSDSSSDAVIG